MSEIDTPDDPRGTASDDPPAFDLPSGYHETTLPSDLRPLVATAYGLDDEPVTVGDWMTGFYRRLQQLEGRALGFDDLCHLDGGDGRHVLRAGGETWEFHCVFDALLVPYLNDGPEPPLVVESRPPGDGDEATITVEVGRGEATVTPAESVLSLGVARGLADEPDAGFDPGRAYGQICAYGNAFPDHEAYEDWAADTADEAATTVVPLRDGFGLARDLVLGPDARQS